MDAKQIKEALKVDLTKDERPLDYLMKLWVDEEEKAEKNIGIQAFERIEVASQSRIFKKLWDNNMLIEPNHLPISLYQLHEIYTVTMNDVISIYTDFRNMSMEVKRFDQEFEEYTLDLIKDELKLMGKAVGDSAQASWITDTCVHIKRYQTLRDVVEPARTVHALQEGLELTGDFNILSDFQVNIMVNVLYVKCVILRETVEIQ